MGQSAQTNSPYDYFEGPSAGNTPDPAIAASQSHVITTINSKFVILNKGQPTNRDPETHLFVDFSEPGYGRTYDPKVVFDRLTNRWFLIFLGIKDDFVRDSKVYLAVSRTSIPRNPPYGSGWCVYGVRPSGAGVDLFPDMPTLGVNNEGVYIGSNLRRYSGEQTEPEERASLVAIAKAPLLDCTPAAIFDKTNVKDIDNLPSYVLQPALELDTFGWQVFLSAPYGAGTRLTFYRLSSPSASLEKSALDVSDWAQAVDTPQLGTTAMIGHLSGWLTGGASYYSGRLVTSHTVKSSFFPANTAVRAYSFNITSGAVATLNKETEFSTSARHYFNASYALNRTGHSLITFNYSSGTDYPGMMYQQEITTGGGFRSPRTLVGGTGPTLTRWGDYAGTAPDPDGDGIWAFNEYGRQGVEGATFAAEAIATV